jgi:hypothetical protein
MKADKLAVPVVLSRALHPLDARAAAPLLPEALFNQKYRGASFRFQTFLPSPRNGQVRLRADETPVINPCKVLREPSRREFFGWRDNIPSRFFYLRVWAARNR